MTDNILFFNGSTSIPLNPDRVLEAAKGKLERVVVVGFNDGDGVYVASSHNNVAEAAMLLELAKDQLLSLLRN